MTLEEWARECEILQKALYGEDYAYAYSVRVETSVAGWLAHAGMEIGVKVDRGPHRSPQEAMQAVLDVLRERVREALDRHQEAQARLMQVGTDRQSR